MDGWWLEASASGAIGACAGNLSHTPTSLGSTPSKVCCQQQGSLTFVPRWEGQMLEVEDVDLVGGRGKTYDEGDIEFRG
jgi:hypothetical protein